MGLLQLSDEMILKIVHYCTTESVISLSETCQKLDNLLQDKLFCEKLIYNWSLRIQRNRFVRFLENSNRALVISSLNITDLYWIPSGVIRTILLRMTNLKELLSAGTQLSWGHLHQTIIQHLPNLEKLSWSWDNRLEMYHRNAGQKSAVGSSNDQENYGKLKTILKDQLLRLRCLLIHIPLLTNCPEAVICSHAALTYLISLCTNLEQLYIVGWPRDETEDSLTANFNKEVFDNDMNFPNLHTVVFSAVERPRISTVRLYNYFITNFKKNNIAPKKLWIEHPLLSLSRRHKVTHGEFTSWNELDLSKVETYSFPLLEEAVLPVGDINQKNYLRKCRDLQVIEGLPRKLSITNLFDESSDLESYCCKSFNHRMDWGKFARLHPKLRSVNVCYDKEICNTDFCVALATLPELRHLAVPIESLIEIRDSTLLSEYNLSLAGENAELNSPSTSTEAVSSRDTTSDADDYLNLFGKKRRIGTPSSSARVTTGVSGLNLLTESCRHVQEFEIGFNRNDSSVGRVLIDSLFSISKWKKLTRLTLDKLPIQNAKFLIEITKSCQQLESLRLNHLGIRGKCVYNNDLCTALTFCHNLRDFRFEQNYYGNTRPLLLALQKCQKLRRVLIYTVPNDVPLEESAVVCLFSKCQELVMFHIIQGSTHKYACDNLRKHLERAFKPSRPNLSVFVKNAHEDFEVPFHPSVHYRQMVCYISQVCQFVDIPKFA